MRNFAQAPTVILAFCAVCVACTPGSSKSDGSAAPSAAPSVASATLPSSSAAPSPSSSAATSPSSQALHAGCDLSRGFQGKVAGKDAFMRLTRVNDNLVGRYFYASIGVDIALKGSITGDKDIALTEGDSKKPTGQFTGTCDRGSFSGTWSGSSPQPFAFTEVTALDNPIIAKKHMSITRTPKTIGPLGIKKCSYAQEDFELFGARTLEGERGINDQAPSVVTPTLLDKDDYNDAAACETGFTAEYARTVVTTWKDFALVQRSGSDVMDGSAHPGNALGYARETYDLRTGKVLTEKDVFSKYPADLAKKCVASFATGVEGAALDEVIVDDHTFSLGPSGVHIFRADYPFVSAVLTGRGPILSYAALLKAGALRSDSPVARAWEGIAPAGPKDRECLPDDGGKE